MATGRTRSKRRRAAPAASEGCFQKADSNLPPAARIQDLAGDPSFMTSLARGLTVIEAFSGNRYHLTTAVLQRRTAARDTPVRERYDDGRPV